MIAFLGFLVTIAILVVFHEFGHYLVARIFGVKIITFSVGFGPKLYTYKGKMNDWCISAIPLGGYVRMLDAREGEVPLGQEHMAFNYKKPWQKILIALAGPIFNIIFAVLAYYFLAIIGITELKPVISSINPSLTQINQINIKPNSSIKKINGINVYTWNEADKLFNKQVQKSGFVEIELQDNKLLLDLQKPRAHFHEDLYLETLGLYPFKYLPIIAYVEPNSPAMKSGLKVNDVVLAIDQMQIKTWFDIAKIIQDSPSKSLNFEVRRNSELINMKVLPETIDNDGQVIGKIGIMPTLDKEQLKANSVIHKYNLLNAIPYAASSCYAVVQLNLISIYHILTGQISVNNLGGPIAIAKAAHGALASGLKDFIDFLALISVGLAIMNLLPIPVLDGGHVIIYAIEWVTGKEVTYEMQNFIFKIGFMLIIGISILAIYNDILRL